MADEKPKRPKRPRPSPSRPRPSPPSAPPPSSKGLSPSKWDDLYDRLTSRKLWLTLMVVGFAAWNYHTGDLNAPEFQDVVMKAVVAFVAAEGATDALAAFRSGTSPAPTPEETPA